MRRTGASAVLTGNTPPETTAPNGLPEWQSLAAHRRELEPVTIQALFDGDARRFEHFSARAAGLHLDFSKNRLTRQTLLLLAALARARGLESAIARLFSGAEVNGTEGRPALHTALRAPEGADIRVHGENIVPLVQSTLARMKDLTRQLHAGAWPGGTGKPVRDVVCIGIGGSHLGPKMVTTALRPYRNGPLRCRFVANIDGAHITEVLQGLDAETTLFLVASKSFTTRETLANARTARDWFLQQGGSETDLARHFIAVTANTPRATEFGVAPANVFPMWDWVGGRYSLWSAIGLPICFSIGFEHFQALLAGAREMDTHFRDAPIAENMPALLALLAVWHRNFWGAASHAVVPYDHSLRTLPAYLQQLDMESSGKSVRNNGQAADYPTGPVLWGGEGSNGQHAFHQLLHQGSDLVPVDFIVPLRPHHGLADQHTQLFASCLSQGAALMHGRTAAEAYGELVASGLPETEAKRLAPHKAHPGNRPSNTLTMDQLTPRTLGALIALYEHRVFTQGVIWDINPFDQWGVELGKQLAGALYEQLQQPAGGRALDSSTAGQCARYSAANRGR